MHLKARALSTFIWVLLAAVAISCSSVNEGASIIPTGNDIVILAQATPELISLVSALVKYPDLVNTLGNTGTFTVFAPANKRNPVVPLFGSMG